MNLVSQYLGSNAIKVSMPFVINNELISMFVDEYRSLLKLKEAEPSDFAPEAKELSFVIGDEEQTKLPDDTLGDFDMVFISYIALFKHDFPNVEIRIVFLAPGSDKSHQFFKINHHRCHLFVNEQKEIFKLYYRNKEYSRMDIVQSNSYIPPLTITPSTLNLYFDRKTRGYNYKSLLENLAKTIPAEKLENRESAVSTVMNTHRHSLDKTKSWASYNVSEMYFLKALYDLYLLRYTLDKHAGRESNYGIGVAIRKEDKELGDHFRKIVYGVLAEYDVFSFNEVEVYFFSLIIQNSQLFKIPQGGTKVMFQKIKHSLSPHEIVQLETNKEEIKLKYIEIYADNLRRIITYSKDIAYGLQELAKNTVEHTRSRCGIISGRIYERSRIISLKEDIDQDWVSHFSDSDKFFDINVIDAGTNSIKSSYSHMLEREKDLYDKASDQSDVYSTMIREYNSDIGEVNNYNLHHFFNFNSVRLFHQINRTKARLGLLIFSQTMLNDKKAFVRLASNDLAPAAPVEGFDMFENNGRIKEKKSPLIYTLGTNYNFIVPLKEEFVAQSIALEGLHVESSTASSVFLDLHQYQYDDTTDGIELCYFKPGTHVDVPSDKYEKLEWLKSLLTKSSNKQCLQIIDASALSHVLANSSDWVRFLANVQLTTNYTKELIIYNLKPDIYIEVINILRLFDHVSGEEMLGFWKKDRFVLFFIPIHKNDLRFWFNSLLCCKHYGNFLDVNRKINKYHFNLIRVASDIDLIDPDWTDDSVFDGLLFSRSNKLLNFELLIKDKEDLSLFEETTQSLLNLEIASFLYED